MSGRYRLNLRRARYRCPVDGVEDVGRARDVGIVPDPNLDPSAPDFSGSTGFQALEESVLEYVDAVGRPESTRIGCVMNGCQPPRRIALTSQGSIPIQVACPKEPQGLLHSVDQWPGPAPDWICVVRLDAGNQDRGLLIHAGWRQIVCQSKRWIIPYQRRRRQGHNTIRRDRWSAPGWTTFPPQAGT